MTATQKAEKIRKLTLEKLAKLPEAMLRKLEGAIEYEEMKREQEMKKGA